ncbi:hypothetical protein J2850_001665 [Azospirillum picis]|uniref:Uncharacterized protein n=1 Tax=Azospirillum picis TaxID=488438 RepID=A0ABU0MH68_9PROT|nr:hypothetical protein [Azospirillum picis]MDQ0532779.1 hypothetical protein [Azospirillum picis]
MSEPSSFVAVTITPEPAETEPTGGELPGPMPPPATSTASPAIIEVSLSTLADQMGTAGAVLKPLHDLIAAHVMAAAWRRYAGARAGQGQDRHRAAVGVRA